METESYIQRQLENINHSCTTFIIAYRISSIRDADKIIVLDNGKIIEQGTHALSWCIISCPILVVTLIFILVLITEYTTIITASKDRNIVVNYVNNLSDLLSNGILNTITDLCNLVFILIFMFVMSPKLTLICLCGQCR